ncbi:hypothetical protein JCGZ_01739 [Jatropha curcas]|uniref:Uncharacterized protein n=1 Tax=Jatropha curcas TaxID=180498 RepID=A0A067JGK2_JATCU|nr:hypothetical protein JCGZ_01739 [Jatropha curcas]
MYQLRIERRFHDQREKEIILSLGASPECRRPPCMVARNVPLLDLSGAYTPRLENSPGIRIHASFVHLVSRSVGIKLDNRSTIAFNGTSAIRAPSSKLIEGKHFGGGWKLSQWHKMSRPPPRACCAVAGSAVPPEKRRLSHA